MYSGDKGLSADYYYLDNYGAVDTAKQIYIPFGTYEPTVTGSQCMTGQDTVGELYSNLNRTETYEMIAGGYCPKKTEPSRYKRIFLSIA